MALPADDFDCGITLTPTVRRDSRIVVRQSYYSVPARFIGRQVRVSLRANDLIVFDRDRVVARHPRITRRYHYRDDLDHYLEILLIKPGALAGSTALARARTDGIFTASHDAFLAAARAAHGEAAGTRALIEVLLLHRRMPAPNVLAGIAAALSVGSTSADVVAIEGRKAELPISASAAEGVDAENIDAEYEQAFPAASVVRPDDGRAQVISLTTRRLDPVLPQDTRPVPSVAIYDQLLSRRSKGTA
jgi:hypothetical protein